MVSSLSGTEAQPGHSPDLPHLWEPPKCWGAGGHKSSVRVQSGTNLWDRLPKAPGGMDWRPSEAPEKTHQECKDPVRGTTVSLRRVVRQVQ